MTAKTRTVNSTSISLLTPCCEIVNRRCDDERKNHRNQNSSDHRNGEWLQHLRTRAKGEREWQHSGDCRESGHNDWPQTSAPRLNHRVLRIHSHLSKALVGIEQQDSVLGYNADYHDQSHEGSNVERSSRYEQCKENA